VKHFFDETEFTPTKWNTAKDKADFGNKLLQFILGGFTEKQFTHPLYDRLMNCFGHIAHYNKVGFYDEWFSTIARRAEFIDHLLGYPCWGEAEFTFCDVERAIQRKVRELNLLIAWQGRAADELRERELAILTHLQKKYQPSTVVPVPEPIKITPHTGEQLSLIA
jgi:hypothetical protein